MGNDFWFRITVVVLAVLPVMLAMAVFLL